MSNFFVTIKNKTILYIRIARLSILTCKQVLLIVSMFTISKCDKKIDARAKFDKLISHWSYKFLKICKIQLEIKGKENINPNEIYVFASNHTSLFDIPVILYAIGPNVNIIYKKELEKIPIFGWGLRKSYYISIDRESPREAMGSLDLAIKGMVEDASVIIFPEGTRSRDGNLQNFKRGAFMLASRSGKKIIPTIILGTRDVMSKNTIKITPNKVSITFREPIDVGENITRIEEKKLMSLVWDKIYDYL